MTDVEWIKEILTRIDGQLDLITQDIIAEKAACRIRHTLLDKEITAVAIRAGFLGVLAGTLPAFLVIVAKIMKLW